MACLDTSVVIDLMGRGGRRTARRAADLMRRLTAAGEGLGTTRFTSAELWVGVERSHDPRQEEAAVHRALADLEMFEFDESAARIFGRITAYLQVRGQPAGDMDVLIASVALANGHSIATRNPAHFQAIPGLIVHTY